MLAALHGALRRGRRGSGHQLGSSAQGPRPTIASGQTAAGALSTYLICQAQMGGAELPGGPDLLRRAAQTQGGGGFAWLNEEGTPNLKSETANTWTAGLVFAQLSDNPWLAGFSGSVDWWQVNIQNAIELRLARQRQLPVLWDGHRHHGRAGGSQAATPACQNVGRNLGTGAATTALLTYTNQANIGTAGVDVELNWIAQLSDLGLKSIPGALSFNSQDTFLDYYRTKNSPGSYDVTTNWKDSLGPTSGRHQRGRVWLSPEPRHRLCAAFGGRQPALEVPALGQHRGQGQPAGDHRQRHQSCRRCSRARC